MPSRDDILLILKRALEETQRGAPKPHAFSPELPLLGSAGVLDSLDTMIFLDHVDEMVSAATGKTITVVGEDAFAREESPFRSMSDLADYVLELLGRE